MFKLPNLEIWSFASRKKWETKNFEMGFEPNRLQQKHFPFSMVLTKQIELILNLEGKPDILVEK